MKYRFVLLFFIVFYSADAQDIKKDNFDSKIQSLDNTIKTLYSIISGLENKDRNWELFSFLFKEDAGIILNIVQSSGTKTKYYLKVDEYIITYGKWLKENGIFAQEKQRMISTFKHLNSV